MTTLDFTLGNRYRLVSPLGEGGMARVFVANDLRLGRRVAVKILADGLVHDDQFVQRFQQEAEAAARLVHPNIVSVYDVGQDGNTHFIVMELVEGHNLKETLRRQGPLPLEETVGIGTQLLHGLGYAHAQGLVHRDIKPQNILVGQDGTAKIGDFGIAKAIDVTSATQTAMVLGSAHYLSPEQAAGQPASPRSDLYAVGVVLYEMSTGALPFDGANLLSVAAQHLHDQPLPPSSRNPSLPPAFDAFALRSLGKTPEDRFQDAAEMREALIHVDPEPAPVPETQELHVAPSPPPNETISARPSVAGSLAWALVLALAAAFIAEGRWYLPQTLSRHVPDPAFLVAGAIIGALGLLTLCAGVLEHWRLRYTIDPYSVTIETGILARHRDAIPLPAVVNLQLHQNPIARIFNQGTIVLSTAQVPGQGPVTLRLAGVARASEAYEAILERIGRRHGVRDGREFGFEELG